MVVADSVSKSRFIDNKFKPVLEFLLFDKVPAKKRPLGNVIHYCVRREYQGRGLQHFHLQWWVEDAPIMDSKIADEEKVSAYLAVRSLTQHCNTFMCNLIIACTVYELSITRRKKHLSLIKPMQMLS